MDRLEPLAELISRLTPRPGMFATAMPSVSLIRADAPSAPLPVVYEPCVCLIAQGAKRVSLVDHSVMYDASRYLLVSVDLPLVGHILDASPDAPYLCCKIELDRTVLAELVVADDGAVVDDLPTLAVYPSDPDIVDVVYRLVRLIEQPGHIAALAPLAERELSYRLLAGPHGPALRRIATGSGRLGQISRATSWIREHFREQLRVADVAAHAGMSPSSLHEHFKANTRLTPLEYQKQLRLHEARRLMLTEGEQAASAGFAVGYESPSQFSREYRRLFGASPRKDIERLLSRAD